MSDLGPLAAASRLALQGIQYLALSSSLLCRCLPCRPMCLALVRYRPRWPRPPASSSPLLLHFRLNFLLSAPCFQPSLRLCRIVAKIIQFFPTSSGWSSPLQNLLLLCAASASSLPSLLSAVSIVHLLPEGIRVLPSSCSAISVLLCCSRILLFRSRLLLFLLLFGRPTSFCDPPWPRASGYSCQTHRWG